MDNCTSGSETGVMEPGEGGPVLDALFQCLANSTRRQILGILYDHAPSSLTRRDVATYLAPGYPEDSAVDDSSEGFRRVFTALRHTHLPKLEVAGLIDLHPRRDTVTLSDHPAFEDTGIVGAIRDEVDVDSDSLDALFGALADARRRRILDVLSRRFGPVHTKTLAHELGANERTGGEADVSEATVERILVSLHHVQLHHLSDAGLIEYDADEQMVAYAGHPELRSLDTFRTRTPVPTESPQ